jgi:UDP-N-acetylmuramoyl-L-alanyl-D-glutamate--2,6-diaminopimelate ligase
MKKIMLSELMKLSGVDAQITSDAEISGISESSRVVKKGELFACVRGFKSNGHDYAPEALKKGAAALLCERQCADTPCAVVKDSAAALKKIAAFFYRDERGSVKITGVTGTKGKTTVTYLIDAIYAEKYAKPSAVIGTLKYRIGRKEYAAPNTTPSNLLLNRLIAEAASKNIERVVMEASSHALHQGRLDNFELEAAVITNVTRDHLDYHKTHAAYLAAKLKIIPLIKKGGILAVNRDMKDYAKILKAAKKRPGIRIRDYSVRKNSCMRARIKMSGLSGTHFELIHGGKSVNVFSKLAGLHNVYNVLAAAAVCAEETGIHAVQRAVHSFKGVPGRLEKVYDGAFKIFVDFAHTPDSMENIIKTIQPITKGKIITLFGCGGDRDRGKRPIMGKIAQNLSSVVVVTSDNPRSEKPEDIIAEIMKGIKKSGCVLVETDREKAVALAVKQAAEGDAVLLLGKGAEEYQDIGGVKHPYSEKKAALKAVREKA